MELTGDALFMLGAGATTRETETVTTAVQTRRNAAIVARAKCGDQEAFGQLYDLYGAMVHGILLARVPPDEVEDLMQDVFLTAFRRLDTLRDESAFGGWLGMIARHRAMDYYRQTKETSELTEHLPQPARPFAEAQEILAVIRTLPEAYRETLIWRLVEGLSGPEIAERAGLTPASVRVNLHRGMKMLRERLGLSEAA